MEDIACAAGVAQEDMIGSDLFLYNRMEGSIWGAQEEFISIGRLDDLQCAFASLQAFLEEDGGDSIPVHCVYDNEEVGSGTKQGAGSTFLLDTLLRVNEGLVPPGAGIQLHAVCGQCPWRTSQLSREGLPDQSALSE